MNAFTTDTRKTEYSATVGDRDFFVTVKRYADDGSYNGGQTWVDIEEHVFVPNTPPPNGWDKLIANVHVDGELTSLAAIREAMQEVRGQLKRNVKSWAQYRYWASLEKGGKRGYYTKHANYWRGRIPESAENWKLCKQIWKEITKL